MRRLLIVCFLAATAAASAQDYPLGPDSQVRDVPHGTVEKLVLPPGQFYPGTPHAYALYTPAQAGDKPLPYMIFLDGSSYQGNGLRAPIVLDNLIAAKAIPPMIGIFVDPGVLPAIRPEAQNRYERIFEYDSISNRFSQFLLTELLPAVARQHALSTNPDEHAIAGTSTGAVGAFVAAWHRPDQFRRVLSLIGTYVAMKGADTLPELVRKTEARPIRIWMQDGVNDHKTPAEPYGTTFAGSWPRANEVLFEALQFEGYDAKLTLGTGAHDTKQGAAELPDALRWLWRDFTPGQGVGRIEAHPPAALTDAGWVTRGSVWATVDAGNAWSPVPLRAGARVASIAVAQNGDVLAGIYGGTLLRVHENSAAAVPGQAGGAAFTAGDGDDLYLADLAQGTVIRQSLSGKSPAQVMARGVSMTAPLWGGTGRDGHGRLYFLDRTSDPETPRIGMLDTRRAGASPYYVDAPTEAPSALALSPDGAMLVVTDAAHRQQWSMQLQANGMPSNGEPFYRMETFDDTGGANDAAYDSLGQVYFATAMGVQVCEANGRVAMILNSPVADRPVAGLAFGGTDRGWLYAVVDGELYRRRMKVHGVPVQLPVKPPQPPL